MSEKNYHRNATRWFQKLKAMLFGIQPEGGDPTAVGSTRGAVSEYAKASELLSQGVGSIPKIVIAGARHLPGDLVEIAARKFVHDNPEFDKKYVKAHALFEYDRREQTIVVHSIR